MKKTFGPLNHSDPNQVKEHLKRLANAAYQPLLENKEQVFKTQLRASTDVSRGMFRPDPLTPGGYLAHPITIRAMRKDLFMAGDGFEDLEQWVVCTSCQNKIDLQFWHFCPFCEASLPTPRA